MIMGRWKPTRGKPGRPFHSWGEFMEMADLLRECDRLRIEADAAYDDVRRARAPYGLGELDTAIPISRNEDVIENAERAGDHVLAEELRKMATACDAKLDSLPGDVRAAVRRWHALLVTLSDARCGAANLLHKAGHNAKDIAIQLGIEEAVVTCFFADSTTAEGQRADLTQWDAPNPFPPLPVRPDIAEMSDSMQAELRFELLINGRTIATAGINGSGHLLANVARIKRDPSSFDRVLGGVETLEEWSAEEILVTLSGIQRKLGQCSWGHWDLNVGDEVTIRILDAGVADTPKDADAWPKRQ